MSYKMNERRPIDIQRDSGKSASIGDAGDKSRIVEMIPLGDRMLFVKPNSIHTYQLADQIDPGRTNPNIPDTQQKILSRGSDDAVVARTLITAHTLFKTKFLGSSFNEGRALGFVLETVQDIAAILDMNEELEKLQTEAEAIFQVNQEKGNTLRLPSIPNIEARFEAFSQKACHIVHTLKNIACEFYPNELSKKWINALAELIEKKFEKGSPTAQYVNSTRDFLLRVERVRNIVEHQNKDQNVRVFDYSLLPNQTIDRPRIEIIGLDHEMVRSPILMLMAHWANQLSFAVEGLIVVLCQTAVRPRGVMPISVIELPPEQRAVKQQRYYYGCLFNGQIVRID